MHNLHELEGPFRSGHQQLQRPADEITVVLSCAAQDTYQRSETRPKKSQSRSADRRLWRHVTLMPRELLYIWRTLSSLHISIGPKPQSLTGLHIWQQQQHHLLLCLLWLCGVPKQLGLSSLKGSSVSSSCDSCLHTTDRTTTLQQPQQS